MTAIQEDPAKMRLEWDICKLPSLSCDSYVYSIIVLKTDGFWLGLRL